MRRPPRPSFPPSRNYRNPPSSRRSPNHGWNGPSNARAHSRQYGEQRSASRSGDGFRQETSHHHQARPDHTPYSHTTWRRQPWNPPADDGVPAGHDYHRDMNRAPYSLPAWNSQSPSGNGAHNSYHTWHSPHQVASSACAHPAQPLATMWQERLAAANRPPNWTSRGRDNGHSPDDGEPSDGQLAANNGQRNAGNALADSSRDGDGNGGNANGVSPLTHTVPWHHEYSIFASDHNLVLPPTQPSPVRFNEFLQVDAAFNAEEWAAMRYRPDSPPQSPVTSPSYGAPDPTAEELEAERQEKKRKKVIRQFVLYKIPMEYRCTSEMYLLINYITNIADRFRLNVDKIVELTQLTYHFHARLRFWTRRNHFLIDGYNVGRVIRRGFEERAQTDEAFMDIYRQVRTAASEYLQEWPRYNPGISHMTEIISRLGLGSDDMEEFVHLSSSFLKRTMYKYERASDAWRRVFLEKEGKERALAKRRAATPGLPDNVV